MHSFFSLEVKVHYHLVITSSRWSSSAQSQSLPLQNGVQVHNYNHYFFNVEFKCTSIVTASFRVEFKLTIAITASSSWVQVHNYNHYFFNVEFTTVVIASFRVVFKRTTAITTSSRWSSSAQL
jgi:hypothetical protein